MLCMNQQQLARTTPWVGHLLSEHQIQTGGLSDRCVDRHVDVINSLSSETSRRDVTRRRTSSPLRVFEETRFIFPARTKAHIC